MFEDKSDEANRLYIETLKILFQSLVSYGQILTEERMDTLKSVVRLLVDGLTGKLDKKYYLISLDPGLGKTESIISFLKAWKRLGFKPIGSILIGVSTKKEIDTISRKAMLSVDDFSVVTTDEDYNNLGSKNPLQSPIMFTTQSMIKNRMRGKDFKNLEEFYFKGNIRTLRLWDESFIPAEHFVIRSHVLSGILHPLSSYNKDLTGWLESFIQNVHGAEAGSVIKIPATIPALRKAFIMEKRGGSFVLSKAQEEALRNLRALRGQVVRIEDDGWMGRVIVGAGPRLSPTFAPALIFDASGRVRGLYDAWDAHGDDLIRLPPVVNSYDKLTINVWTGPFGSHTLVDATVRRQALRVVEKTIMTKPHERWLAVHYLEKDTYDIAAELASSLKDDDVSYVHWGRHTAINDYGDIENVIIIGSWHMPKPVYDALYLASSGLPATTKYTEAAELKAGEFQHNMLQAVCRSIVRKGGAATVYMLVSPSPDPIPLIEKTFPGANVVRWYPVKIELSGHAKRIMAAVLAAFRSDRKIVRVPKKAIRESLGIKTSHFSNVVGAPLFEHYLRRYGISIDDNNRYFTRLSRLRGN